MKARLAIYSITLSGWVLLSFYLLYEYREYGGYIWKHIMAYKDFSSLMFHFLIFTAPLISTVLGFFVRERIGLLDNIEKLTERYRDYYDNAPYGYHSASFGMEILEVNNTWLQMLGYEKDDIIGKKRIPDLMPERSREQLNEYHHKLVNEGQLDNLEVDLIKKDGTLLPVVLSSTAFYDQDGKFLRSRTIVKDNSERKKYISALQTVAEYWKHTFDSMPWGVMMLDANGNLLRTNEYMLHLENISPEEIARTSCIELIEKMQNGNSPEPGKESTAVLEFQNPGSERFYRLYGRELTYEGSVINYVFSLVDMTDVKESEKKLLDSRDAFFNMLKDGHAAYKELDELYNHLILAFANAIDAKSPWTKGHSERVTRYATALALEAGLKESDINTLRTASLLHDIGKIGTYDYLLEKPDGLTAGEYDIVKMHPVQSAKILEPIGRLQSVIDIVKYHHEHFDGTGYPEGLKSDDIPLMARILTIADSYDSMTADRPYRKAPGVNYAVQELERCSGKDFDPMLVKMFLKVIEKGMV